MATFGKHPKVERDHGPAPRPFPTGLFILIVGAACLGTLLLGLKLISKPATDPQPVAAVAPDYKWAPKGRVRLTRARDGQFWADVTINGRPIKMMVDTGATQILISYADANSILKANARYGERGEIRLKGFGVAGGVGGNIAVASVELENMDFEGINSRNVEALISLNWSAGPQSPSLLGMSWLKKMGRIELTGDQLIIEQ